MKQMVKIEYNWYEGEHMEAFVIFENKEELEKDLKEIIDNMDAAQYIPEYYEDVLQGLEDKGYTVIEGMLYDEYTVYEVDDYLSEPSITKRTRELKLDKIANKNKNKI